MAEEQAAQTENTSPDSESEAENNAGFWTVQRIAIIAVLVFILLYLIPFIIALIAAVANAEGTAAFFAYFRDLITIGMTLSGLVIIVGIGVLVIQIARFVNLLQSEIKPLTHDTRQAIQDVRSTTAFVQKHGVKPIMQSQSFLAGLVAFLREIMRFSRLLQQQDSETTEAANE